MRYELIEDGILELTFECIPRRDTYANGYLGLFWASYIDQPESLDIHFRGVTDPGDSQSGWCRGVTPAHGTLATHRALHDDREFSHDPAFPLELPFGFSRLRYVEPWYFGVARGMALVQMFRPEDRVWLSQSPSGGGSGGPAWDFQWFIPQPQVGKRYRLQMRAAYLPLERPWDLEFARERVLETVSRSRPDSAGTPASDVRRHAASANAATTPPRPSDRAAAFYYPWYGNPATDGHYSNWNHGVAVLCASWWGRDSFTDRALPGIFQAAEEAGLQVNFHIEPAMPKLITGFTYLDYQPLPPDYYLNRTAHWVREWQNR